jgi:hypothetical protein
MERFRLQDDALRDEGSAELEDEERRDDPDDHAEPPRLAGFLGRELASAPGLALVLVLVLALVLVGVLVRVTGATRPRHHKST